MAALLALVWGLPVFYLPLLGGGWDTYRMPRATFLVAVALCAPWWRGWWTVPEWVLATGIAAQTVRTWDWTPGAQRRGLVWLAGLLILRAIRGLKKGDRDFLARWWWIPLPAVLAYAVVQVYIPGFDPLPRLPAGWWSQAQIAGASTYGNPLFTAEGGLLLLGHAPWPAAATAVLTPLLLGARGPFLALVVAAALTRWGIPALALAPVAGGMFLRRGLTDTVRVRWDIWGRTLALVREHPWIGVGTGVYRFAIRQGGLVGLEATSWIGNAHNDYLERAAEWGILLGLLFAAWVAARCRGSWGLTAVALAACTGFPFDHPATWGTWCLLAGLQGDTRKGGEPWHTLVGRYVRRAKDSVCTGSTTKAASRGTSARYATGSDGSIPM